MAYGQWKIDSEATIKEFGYNPNNLTKGSRKPVKCKCEICGIWSNKRLYDANRMHRCKSILNGEKKCCGCKKFLEVELFAKNRHTSDGYQDLCRECFSKHPSVMKANKIKNKKMKVDINFYFQYTINRLRKKSFIKNIPFKLIKEDLINKLKEQKNKCYYTGIKIKRNPGVFEYNSISIDRKDPLKGYTKDNVVLCCFAINSFKGMMNENEFKNFIKKINPQLLQWANQI